MVRLVLDTNILFTYFWKTAAIHHVFEQPVTAFSPEYALEEIEKHRNEIFEKTGLTPSEFAGAKKMLLEKVTFVPKKEYAVQAQQIKDLLKGRPTSERQELKYDIDFLALALKLHCPLWSNDRLLKTQEAIRVYSTAEVIEILGG